MNKDMFGFRAGVAGALTLCLIFVQAGLSATVDVDLNTTMQTIRGFGGMNHPRWIATMTDAQVDKAFGNGPNQLGLTILRIDIPPTQSDWSKEVSAAARAVSDGAIVFASPWTPPASMKTNNSLIHGELKTDSYGDFATWLTDFADYMSSNGAPLYAVSVQNEPDYDPDYEGCVYSAAQMRAFLDSSASVIPTRVMAPERTGFNLDYLNTVAPSPECDIVAIHVYGGGGYFSYPGKEYWMTEHYTNSGISGNVWPDALDAGIEFHTCLAEYNMNAYVWWYIRRSYGFMDDNGIITKRGYCMSHFSKFVRPGYIRVDATDNPASGVYVSAYKNDANLVIVAINKNSSTNDVTFSLSGGTVSGYTRYETASDVNLFNRGSVGSTNTLAANSINTFVGTISFEDDNTPPNPDPMTWASEPSATGESSITMIASAAYDTSGVEYYFDCLTAGGHDSGWQDSNTYADTVLTPSTSYSYRVQARDKSINQNVTDWSSTLSATTDPPDNTPPDPDPMTWSVFPTATGPGSITMTAYTAYDDSGVEYYFACLTEGGHDSGWQDSPTYTDTGLSPNTSYTYSVQARDKSQNQNETEWSTSLSATTQAPIIQLLGSWVTGTSHTQESGNSRALLFFVTVEKSSSITLNSVTYGGRTMTKIIERTADTSTQAYTAAFILNDANLALASNSTFVPSWSTTPAEYSYQSAFFSNVNQIIPIGPNDTNAVVGNTATLKTIPLATNNGDMVFVAATCGNTINYTVNNGFTKALENDMGSSTGTAGYKSATGVNETPSVTVTGTVNRQSMIGFVLKTLPADLPPANPTGLIVTAGNKLVSLDWADNSEGDLAGYNIYRSTTQGSGYVKQTSYPRTASEFADGNVVNGTAYYYVVTAVDTADHESGYSDESTATPDYQTCADVIADNHRLAADISGSGDCYVDLDDLYTLADNWLRQDCSTPDNCNGADFAPTDGAVDFFDFSDFAEQWLTCNDPANPNCTPNW